MIKSSKYEFLSSAECPSWIHSLKETSWATVEAFVYIILGMFIFSDITQSSKQEKVSETEFSDQFEPDLDI